MLSRVSLVLVSLFLSFLLWGQAELARSASSPALNEVSSLRDFLDLEEVDREFHIDANNGFRSWVLVGEELVRFLDSRVEELEDPLCARKLLFSVDHLSRTAAGLRMQNLSVSEFVMDGRVARVDLLPKYSSIESTTRIPPISAKLSMVPANMASVNSVVPEGVPALPSVPPYQCPARKPVVGRRLADAGVTGSGLSPVSRQ